MLQVSVRNDLTQTVTNLKLVLTPAQPNRLRVELPTEELVLPASQSVTLRFPAEAKNNGPVSMTAQLYTTGPNPQKYGEPVTFTVQVTSVTNGVLYVFGGGALLLLLAALRFVRQRKRRVAHGDEGDAPLTPQDGGTGPDDTDGPGRGEGGDGPGAAADAADADRPAGPERPEHLGAARTPRDSSADGRDRATSDEKVGP